MTASEEQMLSLEEVAERLQVSGQTIRRWIKGGRLMAYKPGLEWRIRPSDLEAFLETRGFPKALRSSPIAAEDQAGEERSPESLRREFQEHSDSLEPCLRAWEDAAALLRERGVPYHDYWGRTIAYAASFLWTGLERHNVLDSLQPQGAFAEALASIDDLPEPLRREVVRLYDCIDRLTQITSIVMEAEKASREERNAGTPAGVVDLTEWETREKSLPPRPRPATGAESA